MTPEAPSYPLPVALIEASADTSVVAHGSSHADHHDTVVGGQVVCLDSRRMERLRHSAR